MLHSLKIKNFYSFREEQEFSLLGTKSTSDDQRFMTTPSGRNIAKIAMIYGANASGKTNFLKAFSFLSWFIRYSWRNLSQNEHFSFMPFIFTNSLDKKTSFKVVVESENGHIYTYNLELTPVKIYKESLKVQWEGKGRHLYLFSRTEDSIKTYKATKFSMKKTVETLLRSNASFISTLLQTKVDIFSDCGDAMIFKSNVQFFGRTQKDVHTCFDILMRHDKIRYYVEDFIKNSDTGISRIEIKEFKVEEEEERKMISLLTKNIPNIPLEGAKGKFSFYEVSTIHTIKNIEYKFSFDLESNGTQQVISFLAEALSILQDGGVFVYDELEHGIHPLLIQRILDLFYDEATNPRRSQLICTCHATDVLNFLHKRQIFLTEKNDDQESSLYRLSDVAGVRNDDNIMQKYLSGTYGGVPYL